jgi:hypothetical protein
LNGKDDRFVSEFDIERNHAITFCWHGRLGRTMNDRFDDSVQNLVWLGMQNGFSRLTLIGAERLKL